MRAVKLPSLDSCRIGPRPESCEIRTDLSPWYRACTKEIFIPKGRYGDGENRNLLRLSVQQTDLPVRAVKIPHLEGGGIGPRTESCVNWDGPIAMVPCLQKGNLYTKRKLRAWRDQKCILLVGAITPLTWAGRQNTTSRGRQYGAQYVKLPKLGWTYRHGTVLSPRKYLYQKEPTGMERLEMYSASRCNNPTYLCTPSKYPVSREAV